MMRYLRYTDLKRLGIVRNRASLGNWIRDLSFPPGQMIGPNTRAWNKAEVMAWLAARPTAKKAIDWTPKSRKAARTEARA